MKPPKLTPDQKAQVLGDPPAGRTPLCWLVVNPDGKLLAILDSESEAYWFTRNRGHAYGAVYFKAPCDYAAAPDLLAALQQFTTLSVPGFGGSVDTARQIVANATGRPCFDKNPAHTGKRFSETSATANKSKA